MCLTEKERWGRCYAVANFVQRLKWSNGEDSNVGHDVMNRSVNWTTFKILFSSSWKMIENSVRLMPCFLPVPSPGVTFRTSHQGHVTSTNMLRPDQVKDSPSLVSDLLGTSLLTISRYTGCSMHFSHLPGCRLRISKNTEQYHSSQKNAQQLLHETQVQSVLFRVEGNLSRPRETC